MTGKMSGVVVSRSIITTAVGAGILIGATGLYVFLKLVQKMKKPSLDRNLSALDLSIATLEEFGDFRQKSYSHSSRQSFRSVSSRSSKLKRSHNDSANGYESDDEMFSLLSSDGEYYDLSSDEFDDEGAEKLFEEVDGLLKGNEGDRLNALKLLKTEESRFKGNPDFLWRMAKIYQMQATATQSSDNEKKKEFVDLGLEYAEEALKIDPSNSDAHKWYAILVGMLAQFQPVKEKIQTGLKFRKHLTIALDGKPEDATLHHLLGRFKYEIASLSWVERKLASTLVSEMPNFTMDNALHDFKNSEKFNPGWVENGLYIGKCYVGLSDYENAFKWFDLTEKIKPVTPEDKKCHDEIVTLKAKYSKYRK